MPRKPLADESTQTSLRLPRELHDRLSAAAGERGIGDEIRRRLEASFAPDEVADAKTRELARLVTHAAEIIGGVGERGSGGYYWPWHTDPFSFEVFKLVVHMALDKALAYYRPEGEAVPKPNPTGIADLLYDHDVAPEEVAVNLLHVVLSDLIGKKS